MKRIVVGALTVLAGAFSIGDRTLAQVVPDNTVGSTVNLNGTRFEINNGMRSGTNLFHSFSQFSVPTGSSAIFNNTTDIQTIFSRVTGSQISNIDGILKSQGTANLFLMNPSGIIFGPNARLELGGAFLGTTASGLKFGDGIEFNTVNETPALLSINLPIGLQFGPNPGTITSQGATLETATDQAFLLLGGDINQIGGSIKSNGGRIEMGSVQQAGMISLAPDWTVGYDTIQTYGDIRFTQAALLSSDGEGSGGMQFQGRQIQVREYSLINAFSLGAKNGGDVKFKATDRIEVSDVSANGSDYSSLRIGVIENATGNSGNLEMIAPTIVVDGGFVSTQTRGLGNAGNITIKTDRFGIYNSGQVATITFGLGNGGNANITATQSVEVDGYLPTYEDNGYESNGFFIFSSGIFVDAERGSSGNGGTLNLTTDRLQVSGGGRVSSSVYATATGNAGSTFIRANDILVDGVVPNEVGDLSGIKASVQPGANGNGGILDIRANTVRVINGGQISVANAGTGQAGNMTINTRSLNISGTSSDGLIPSRIAATATSTLPAGSIDITADTVNLRDRAIIAVSSLGTGDAGNLTITANNLQLDASSLQSEVKGGSQGNINLMISQAIILRNRSSISTNASSTANGGNIKINTPILVGINNSDIVANATKGQGGNVTITTQGILGLKFRPKLTDENDITASSEFGINGNVQVNAIGINPANSLNALSANVIDSSRQIADQCGTAKTSSLIVTGRGGMPKTPGQRRGSDRPWNDFRSLTVANPVVTSVANPNLFKPIVEASAIQVDGSGTIALVAPRSMEINSDATCAFNP